jgi:micrococcal nuclease
MYEYNAKILKVVDGDTVDIDIDLGFDIVIKDERVRLAGIDTPESRTRDLEEKKFGLLSKQFLKDRLVKGKTYKLVTEKYDSKGKFGRIIGDFHIFNETNKTWKSVCQLLIENRMAVPYHGQSKDDVKDLHETNRKYLYEKGIVQ